MRTVSNDIVNTDAHCEAGEVATGGGALGLLPVGCAMITSFEIDDGTGWRVAVACGEIGLPGSYAVQVRCLSVS